MERSTEVLVVGAGPVGLVLAGDLGWRGRQCIVVERGDGVIGQPKMDQVGIRTMELCRRWGIVDQVEASPYVRSYPQDNVYLTSLNSYELGRETMPAMQDEKAPPESPQHRERCPQNMFDPILQRFAASQPGVELLYRHRFVSLRDEGAKGVTAQVTDPKGRTLTIRARYLVGCDGGRSPVREQLGIGMQGRGLLTFTTNVVFRCAEFNALHDKRPGYRYMFVGPEGVWATIVAINGADQWRMSLIGNNKEQRTYSEQELREVAHRLLGKPFDLEILSVLPWTRLEQVADQYGKGNVFLAGDACHLTSPTGGLGMNTGIGDAADLSWKLAARLEGWGGPALEEAYGIERRPVARRITQFSTGNLATMLGARSDERLFKPSPAGDAVRARVGKALTEGLKREWYSMNMHLGYRYVDSPVCVYSEPEDPAQIEAEYLDGTHYRPSTRPGCRAPHAWMADGRSTLDLFGRGFVLMCLGAPASDAAALQRAAKGGSIPLSVHAVDEPHIVQLYEKRFVLVRPDGHVAWRADEIPAEAHPLMRTVAGNSTRNQHHEALSV